MNPYRIVRLVFVLLALHTSADSQAIRGFTTPPSPSSTLQQGKYYALFLANQDYSDKNIPQLTEPYNDAIRLRDVLTEKYNFNETNVKMLKNPKRADFYTEFGRLSQLVTENDYLVIFYAGHGSFDERRKQGYWWPSDAQKDNQSMWISNGDIRDQLKGINAKHILLIADACFSGGIFRTRGTLPNASFAIEELAKKPSRRAMTSGTLNEVPDKSVFVDFLVKRLTENEEQYLTAQNLFASFQDAVTDNSPIHQLPQYGVIQEVGDEGGDFIFYQPVEFSASNTLLLRTSPPDADVFIDGRFVGKTTPELKIAGVTEGKQLLEVKKDGYAVFSSRIDSIDVKENRFDVALEPLRYADLVITAAASVKVFINDKPYGDVRKQLKIPDLALGKYDVKLIADGYKPFMQTLFLTQYGEVHLSADLKPLTATINFSGATRAEAFIDDSFAATTPAEGIEVPPGAHTVLVKRAGYETYEKRITAGPDKPVTILSTLLRKTSSAAMTRSLMFPGYGQWYNERYRAGYAWAGSFILAVGNLVYRQVSYNDKVQSFNNAANAYIGEQNLAVIFQKKTLMLEAEKNKNDAAASRNTGIYIAAGIYLLNIADIYFTAPAFDQETLSLQIGGDPNNVTASAAIRF